TYTAYSPKKQGVTLSNITVHKSPSTGAATIGRFVSGTTLKLDGLHTTADGVKWYRVYTNGQTGYILEKNVRLGTTSPTTPEATYIAYSPKKQGVTLSNITVHKSPSTGAATIGRFVSGALLKLDGLHTTADGVKWYQVYTNGQKGYILAKNVDTSNIVTDSDFEAMLTKQKFPESYKPYLRNIHKKHPTWSFTALHTGMSWSTVQTKEQRLGNNLVEPTVPDSWKSKKPGAYNPKTGVYTKFDGRWNQAGDHVIAYYMDPRNFLNDSEIFQFMDHYFYTSMSKKEYISKIVSGSFMNSSLYINSLYNAGSKVGVNPNVLAAMVIMEQGWNGSSLCSGKYPGYEGYYNHFNIGAYTAGGMSAVQRGLWYAKGSGIGSTTYGRPWNTIERSLAGGVQFYASGYVKKNQYTYYLKKFNVMNGPANVATHEYMTNVQGAYGEGMLLKRAYTNVEAPLVFRIPVYTNMPSKPAPKP
ncbi:MAG: SH3 domain-containing protein, partial [Anaerovoracaceae bacterium]